MLTSRCYDPLRSRWEKGLERDAGSKSLADFLTEFLAYYKRDGGVAPSTIQDYRYHIESHIVPVLGKVLINELDARRVDGFMRTLNEKGLAARTSQYSYSVLRRALQFAVDWKYIYREIRHPRECGRRNDVR